MNRFFRFLTAAVRQALSGRGFLLGAAGVTAVLFLSSLQDIIVAFRSSELLEEGFHHRFIIKALSSEGMTLAHPILAALPFTSSVVDDRKSGFLKEYLPRTTVSGYICGRIAGCVLSGGGVFITGISAAYAVAALLFMPMEAAGAGAACLGELAEMEILFGCSGGLWSMVGMLLAVLTESRYVAYASPFVLYYVLIILHERYFDELYVFYPREWILPSEQWMFGSAGVICFVSELTVIAALCFGRAVSSSFRK